MHFSIAVIFLCAFVTAIQGQSRTCSGNDAFPHNGFYYQFFDCAMNWKDAEATCQNGMIVRGRTVRGGHLVSILDEFEAQWLQFQLNQHYGVDRPVGVWIGLRHGRRRGLECPLPTEWVDGNSLSFTNYLDQQPNCYWDDEECFHLYNNAQWNDAECQAQMRFVCKVPMTRIGETVPDVSPFEETTVQFLTTTQPQTETDEPLPVDNAVTDAQTPPPPHKNPDSVVSVVHVVIKSKPKSPGPQPMPPGTSDIGSDSQANGQPSSTPAVTPGSAGNGIPPIPQVPADGSGPPPPPQLPGSESAQPPPPPPPPAGGSGNSGVPL